MDLTKNEKIVGAAVIGTVGWFLLNRKSKLQSLRSTAPSGQPTQVVVPVHADDSVQTPLVIQGGRAASIRIATVSDLQHALNFLKFCAPLVVNGQLDASTIQCLLGFQTASGIPTTGRPDSTTILALEEAVRRAAISASSQSTALYSVSTTSLSSPRDIQRALNILGASPRLKEDGVIGPATRAAIKAFQVTHGIPASGDSDIATLAAMTAAMTFAAHGEAEKSLGGPSAAGGTAPAPSHEALTAASHALSTSTLPPTTSSPHATAVSHPLSTSTLPPDASHPAFKEATHVLSHAPPAVDPSHPAFKEAAHLISHASPHETSPRTPHHVDTQPRSDGSQPRQDYREIERETEARERLQRRDDEVTRRNYEQTYYQTYGYYPDSYYERPREERWWREWYRRPEEEYRHFWHGWREWWHRRRHPDAPRPWWDFFGLFHGSFGDDPSAQTVNPDWHPAPPTGNLHTTLTPEQKAQIHARWLALVAQHPSLARFNRPAPPPPPPMKTGGPSIAAPTAPVGPAPVTGPSPVTQAVQTAQTLGQAAGAVSGAIQSVEGLLNS